MSNSTQTLYDILAVPADADVDTIKASYKRLIRSYHPDIVGDAGVVMTQRLNEAWDTLGDATKRHDYDSSMAKPEPEPEPAPTFKPSPRPTSTPRESTSEPQPEAPTEESADQTYMVDPALYNLVNGTLIWTPKQHKVWRIITAASFTILGVAMLVCWSLILNPGHDQLHGGPLRNLVLPYMSIFGCIVFFERRSSWFKRIIFGVLYALPGWIGPGSLLGISPWTDLAKGFSIWEVTLITTVVALTFATKYAYIKTRKLGRTKKLYAA